MDFLFLFSIVNVLLAATAQGFVLQSGSEGILWSNDPHCGEGEHKGMFQRNHRILLKFETLKFILAEVCFDENHILRSVYDRNL